MLQLRNKYLVQTISLASASLILSGCFHTEEDENATSSDHYAIISTQASDNSAGDISIISLEDYSTDNTNFAGGSDTVVSTYDKYIYRLGRFGQDNITRLDVNDLEATPKQYSTDDIDDESSNPYKLVVKNDTTGYLIRYGTSKIWVVNPLADTAEDFKTAEIDLSVYSGSDNIPEMTDALIVDDKLYILMQNLDRDNGWIPQTAYVAVIDTNNGNDEIETNTDANTPKGIQLTVTNPNKMVYLSSNNTIYISGVGPYFPADYSGGIESINLADNSTSLVVDDGDTDTHPYGQINNIAILNSTRGYFVGYSAWQDTAIYSFNPTTGAVDDTALLENKDISDIEIGPLGNLWVTDRNNSGITIFNTVDNSVLKELIDTDLVPSDIEFISVPKSEE